MHFPLFIDHNFIVTPESAALGRVSQSKVAHFLHKRRRFPLSLPNEQQGVID